jgi:hypothetical protein
MIQYSDIKYHLNILIRTLIDTGDISTVSHGYKLFKEIEQRWEGKKLENYIMPLRNTMELFDIVYTYAILIGIDLQHIPPLLRHSPKTDGDNCQYCNGQNLHKPTSGGVYSNTHWICLDCFRQHYEPDDYHYLDLSDILPNNNMIIIDKYNIFDNTTMTNAYINYLSDRNTNKTFLNLVLESSMTQKKEIIDSVIYRFVNIFTRAYFDRYKPLNLFLY